MVTDNTSGVMVLGHKLHFHYKMLRNLYFSIRFFKVDTQKSIEKIDSGFDCLICHPSQLLAHPSNRLDGAGLAAVEKMMTVNSPDFVKSVVIEPPNERGIAFRREP